MTLLQKVFPKNSLDDTKILLKASFPLFMTNLSHVILFTISLVFCGHIGTLELDAASLAITVLHLTVTTTAHGFASACETLFPQIFGGREEGKKKIGSILQKGILIGITVSFFASAIILNLKYFLMLFVSDQMVVKLADKFLAAFIPSVFFINISTVLSRYVQTQVKLNLKRILSRQKLKTFIGSLNVFTEALNFMFTIIVSIRKLQYRIINIVPLNIFYPIMFVNFLVASISVGMHSLLILTLKMGITGAAISTDIATFFLMVCIIIYIYFTKIYEETWPGWSYLYAISNWRVYLKLAIPGFFLVFFRLFVMEMGIFLAGTIGVFELGIMSISRQMLHIFNQLIFAISLAGNIHIGQLLGKNEPEKARNSALVLAYISATVIGILAIIMLALSDLIPYAFTDDNEIILKSGKVLKLAALVLVLEGSQGVSQAIIQSVNSQLYSAIYFFIGFYFVGLPISIALLLETSLKIFGFYIGYIIGSVIFNVLQFIHIYNINWTQKTEIVQELAKNNDKSELFEENKEQRGGFKKLKNIKLLIISSAILIFAIGLSTHFIYSFHNVSQFNLAENISKEKPFWLKPLNITIKRINELISQKTII